MGLRMNSVGKFGLRARGPISDTPGFALRMLGKLTSSRLSFLIFIRTVHYPLRQNYSSCLELSKRLLKGKLQLLLLLHLPVIPLKLSLRSQDTQREQE